MLHLQFRCFHCVQANILYLVRLCVLTMQAVLRTLEAIDLAQYAQRFEDRGWDELMYIQSMDHQGLREVALDIGMKPGHVHKFVNSICKLPVEISDSEDDMHNRLESSDGQDVMGAPSVKRPRWKANTFVRLHVAPMVDVCITIREHAET